MIIGINGRIASGKDTTGKVIQFLVEYHDIVKNGYESEQTLYQEFIDFEKEFDIVDHTWQIKKFADRLKDIVCLLTGCTREQLEDQEFKNRELGKEWNCYFNSFIGKLYLTEEEALAELYAEWDEDESCLEFIQHRVMTPRLLLQLLGTDCGRDIIHPNIWVNSLMNEYKPLGYSINVMDNTVSEVEFIKGRMVGIPTNTKPTYPNWIITDLRFPNEMKAVKDRNGISIRVKRPQLIPRDFEHESEKALDNAIFDYEIDNNSTIEELIEKVREILIKEKII